jgi:aminopeptidase YwaD
MNAKRSVVLIADLLFLFFTCSGQNSVPRPLLSGNVIDEIIGEASGERTMRHIYDLAAYNHDRLPAEYSDQFIETRYVYDKLKEYGLESVVINKYPGGYQWDGIRGEIWEISPGKSKIADYGDLTAMLAQGSANTDVTAELIWIGEGRQADIDRVDVKGKIVVTSGSMQTAYSLAVPKGALGVISYESPHPLSTPLAIPFHFSNFNIAGNSTTKDKNENVRFGFFLPPREGIILRDRLLGKDKITVHVVVETAYLNFEVETTTCIIKGSDPAAGEIILSAHLFDGLVKMGANDNLSGCASILEIARMLNRMINEGRIARPRRTIRFIWAPEYSGTIPWVRENKEIVKNTLCNINLDMVGLWLSKYQSLLYMHRTEFGNPHYINDVMENYYDLVGFGNRIGLGVGGNLKRIVAPSGSDDPFLYTIDDNAKGSDHDVFNDWGVQVPGIMMLTWPDPYYHSSQDNADKCDPTQLKRVCVIGAAAAYTIAAADEAMASKIACEVAGNALGRIGRQVTRAMDELDKTKKEEFEVIYKKTKGFIEASIINEKATLATVSELVSNSSSFNTYLTRQSASVEAAGKAALASYDSYAENKAKGLGLAGISFKPTALELKARKILPEMTSLVTERSYKGYSEILANLDPKIKEKYPVKDRGMDTVELGRLCNGRNTALDIKKMLDAQMKEGGNDLQNVINHIYILREAGLVTFDDIK